MGEQLRRGSQFSDSVGKTMYSDYLNTETDRLALDSKESHLEKILKFCHADFVSNPMASGAHITPNLEGLSVTHPANMDMKKTMTNKTGI